MGTMSEQNNASSTPVSTAFTATTPRRGRPKMRPEINDAQRAAVRLIFAEVGKARECKDYMDFNDVIRPIRQEICWATGWRVWPEVTAAWNDVQSSATSRIPAVARQQLVDAEQQARQRMGVGQ